MRNPCSPQGSLWGCLLGPSESHLQQELLLLLPPRTHENLASLVGLQCLVETPRPTCKVDDGHLRVQKEAEGKDVPSGSESSSGKEAQIRGQQNTSWAHGEAVGAVTVGIQQVQEWRPCSHSSTQNPALTHRKYICYTQTTHTEQRHLLNRQLSLSSERQSPAQAPQA